MGHTLSNCTEKMSPETGAQANLTGRFGRANGKAARCQPMQFEHFVMAVTSSEAVVRHPAHIRLQVS